MWRKLFWISLKLRSVIIRRKKTWICETINYGRRIAILSKKKFYDTCALLAEVNNNKLFDEKFYISSITLHELEHIKTSKTKTEEIRCKARKITRLLDKNYNKYDVVVLTNPIKLYIEEELELDYSIPDNQIVGIAKYIAANEDIVFITNDICLKNIARSIGLTTESTDPEITSIYKGYKVIKGTADIINEAMYSMDMSDWHVNEYLIIEDTDSKTTKEMRYDGEKFVPLKLPSSRFLKAKNSLQRTAAESCLSAARQSSLADTRATATVCCVRSSPPSCPWAPPPTTA